MTSPVPHSQQSSAKALADFLAQQNRYHSESMCAQDPIIQAHISQIVEWEKWVRASGDVRAAVIEECAKVADSYDGHLLGYPNEEAQLFYESGAIDSGRIIAGMIRDLSQAPATDAAPDPSTARIVLLEAALKEIRSNANCHTKDLALATMPLIFQTATRAIRGDSI